MRTLPTAANGKAQLRLAFAAGVVGVATVATPIVASAEVGGFAEPDTAATMEDVALPVVIGVLANDDPSAVITAVTQGTFGSVGEVVVQGTTVAVTYQPNPDANGVDTFTYTVEVAGASGVITEEETVTITVEAVDEPVEDPPAEDPTTPVDEDNPYFGAGGLEGEVVRIYSAMLGRRPDLGGFQYWVDQRTEGLTFEGMVDRFADSPEFKSIYGDKIRNATDEEWVEFVYSELMGRASEPVGLAFWLDAMESGRFSRSAMVIFFAQSPEYRTLTGTV